MGKLNGCVLHALCDPVKVGDHMQTLRTAKAAAEIIRERDPNTTMTEYAIRTLMDSGELPYIAVGHKRILSIESIEKYVNSQLER